MKMNNYTNREFVFTYIRSDTVKEVAKTLGTSVSAVNRRAKLLRDEGVNLPKKVNIPFSKLKSLERDELNNLVTKWQNGSLK